MNCIAVAFLVKDIESSKVNTSILQQSYEIVPLTCQETSKTTTPDDTVTEPVQHVSPDPV